MTIVQNSKDNIFFIKQSKNKKGIKIPNEYFALYFKRDQTHFDQIFLKPLNEYFFQNISGEDGIILSFSREYIEEYDPEYALDVLNLFNLTPDKTLTLNQSINNKLASTLNLLEIEYNEKSNNLLIIKTVLKVLLLQLIHYQNTGFIAYEANNKRSYFFLHLMEKHYKTETNAKYYAAQLGISEKRLNQILKSKLNKTAKQIIQQRQIVEIRRMLTTKKYTIKEIAFDLSFTSVSNFIRFFKRNTGMTPSEFRKHNDLV